jgi:hypothetical protein
MPEQPVNIGVSAVVRLTPEARENQPEIGFAVGKVLEVMGSAVRVDWPDRTAWHRLAQLERAP